MTKTPLRVGVSLPFSVASSRLHVIPALSVEVLCFVCIFWFVLVFVKPSARPLG